MFRRKGTIVEWNDDRGFGFIAPAKGGERVFCHIKSFRNLTQRPARGQVYTYQLARDMGGRSRAREIHPADVDLRTSVAPPQDIRVNGSHPIAAYAGSLLLLLALTALVYLQRLPWPVFPWYLGLSLVTFVVYGWDKASAQGGFRRTPEKSLNALALAGGWPGGWIAMESFRHKTQKASFRRGFWFAVALNVLVLGGMAYGGPDAWGAYVPGAHQKSYKQP
jgi:uncharacterized membrane protein YsdA (DUF1294 family)/cold shock CspA family protein